MPISAMAATTAGLISSAGVGAGGADMHPAGGVVVEECGGHLGTAGVVDADEQHLGGAVAVIASSWLVKEAPSSRRVAWTWAGVRPGADL